MNEFLTQNTVPYMGAKDQNLPFIEKILNEFSKNIDHQIRFVDLFSGNGSVSRLAKLKGYEVITNDLEHYSRIFSSVPLMSKEKVEALFITVCEKLGLDQSQPYLNAIEYLNQLVKPKYPKNLYFSKFFAPKDTKNPDKTKERLYYTQENALKIDAIIEAIFNVKNFSKESREICLYSLFKGMLNIVNNENHLMRTYRSKINKGNKEIKARVLAPMVLEPVLFLSEKDYPKESQSFKSYAESFLEMRFKGESFDFVYLDPPYSQQQYGVNYSHLTSAYFNDKQPIEDIEKGKKFETRKDLDQSKFCRRLKDRKTGRKLAYLSLKKTIDSIQSKYILYSFVPNSILTPSEILEALSNDCVNKITLRYEEKERTIENVRENRQEIAHIMLVVEKNAYQTTTELKSIEQLLLSTSLKADNENFGLKGKFLNVKELVQNTGWKIQENHITYKYKLFHNDKFIFNVTFDLEIEINIDTDFTEEEKQMVSKYFITQDEAKALKNKKESMDDLFNMLEQKFKEKSIKKQQLLDLLNPDQQQEQEQDKESIISALV